MGKLDAVTPASYRTHRARVTVDESTGCWVYRLPLSDRGRPRITVNGQDMAAYEFFWLAHRRQEVPPGMVLLHSCDRGERGCVNPDHLSIGTRTENNRQAVERGRHRNQHTGRLRDDDDA
jgi:hypothetical protein